MNVSICLEMAEYGSMKGKWLGAWNGSMPSKGGLVKGGMALCSIGGSLQLTRNLANGL